MRYVFVNISGLAAALGPAGLGHPMSQVVRSEGSYAIERYVAQGGLPAEIWVYPHRITPPWAEQSVSRPTA